MKCSCKNVNETCNSIWHQWRHSLLLSWRETTKPGQLARNNKVQLSTSSLAIHGGAIFSAVSGRKSIPISAIEAPEHGAWYRVHGFYLTTTFCSTLAQQAVSLWNCRVCWRISLFYSYGFVTNGKYLWSPRREILQFQWQFQLETACCAKVEQKVVVR